MAVERRQPQVRRRRGPAGRARAAAYDGWGFVSTMVGWLLLLIGQRVVDPETGLDTVCTLLAVLLLIAAFGQRLWAAMEARAERKSAAVAMAVLSGLGLLALAGWYAVSESGRQALGFELPKPGKPDSFGDTLTVAWIALLAVSVLPGLLGELARWSMRRAARVESRRVMAAVVSGAAVALMVISGALFAYGSAQLDWFVDYSYFRTARPSESTRHMLDNLDEPLDVVVFFPGFSEVRGKVVRYLEDLRRGSDKLKVQAVDKMLHPELAAKYKGRREGVVVPAAGEKHETTDLGPGVPLVGQHHQGIRRPHHLPDMRLLPGADIPILDGPEKQTVQIAAPNDALGAPVLGQVDRGTPVHQPHVMYRRARDLQLDAKIGNDALARRHALQPGVGPSFSSDRALGAHDAYRRQVVALTHFEVVCIVRRRHLHGAGTESGVNERIGHDRERAPQEG